MILRSKCNPYVFQTFNYHLDNIPTEISRVQHKLGKAARINFQKNN